MEILFSASEICKNFQILSKDHGNPPKNSLPLQILAVYPTKTTVIREYKLPPGYQVVYCLSAINFFVFSTASSLV